VTFPFDHFEQLQQLPYGKVLLVAEEQVWNQSLEHWKASLEVFQLLESLELFRCWSQLEFSGV
jgi:hypothetical protein